jgi:hypothetical protein
MCRASRGRLLPWVASASSWLARTFTIANSLATKKPFRRTRKTTAKSLRNMMPGTSQLVAGASTAPAAMVRKGRVIHSVSGTGIIVLPKARVRTWLAARRFRCCFEEFPRSSWSLSLRGKGDLRPTNLSKTAVVAENILMPA